MEITECFEQDKRWTYIVARGRVSIQVRWIHLERIHFAGNSALISHATRRAQIAPLGVVPTIEQKQNRASATCREH